jgi:hypothetical protein
MAPLSWQRIENISQPTPGQPGMGNWIVTERAQIPAGWLVRTYAAHREVDQPSGGPADVEFAYNVSITFVPGPTSDWK